MRPRRQGSEGWSIFSHDAREALGSWLKAKDPEKESVFLRAGKTCRVIQGLS